MERLVAAYPVRTASDYVTKLVTAFGVHFLLGGAIIGAGISGQGTLAEHVAFALVIGTLAIAFPVGYWRIGTNHLRVGGVSRAIRVFADHVEVPGSSLGSPITFARDSLRVRVRPVGIRWNGRTRATSRLIELRCGSRTRELSSRVFADPRDVDRLVAELCPTRVS